MGKIICKGKVCVDEETGATFFLPDPECNPEDFAEVRRSAIERGIAFIEPIRRKEPRKKVKD